MYEFNAQKHIGDLYLLCSSNMTFILTEAEQPGSMHEVIPVCI